MFKRIKVRTNILLHFLFIALMLAISLTALQYYFSMQMAKEGIEKTFNQAAHNVVLSLRKKDHLSKEMLYQIETHTDLVKKVDDTLQLLTVTHFIRTLERYNDMYAIYMGYPNGDLFEVFNMHINKKVHTHYLAPKSARWGIIKVYESPQGRVREFVFLDNDLKILAQRQEPSTYHVTTRPWYVDALAAGGKPFRSDPYLFSNLQERGITYAKSMPGTKVVLALDFTLAHMKRMLRSLQFAQSGRIYLFGRDGEVISTSHEIYSPIEAHMRTMITQERINTIQTMELNGDTVYSMIIPLSKELGRDTYIGVCVHHDEMFAPYREKILYALLFALVLLVISIPLILYLTDHIVRPIKALMNENEMIKQRKFDKVKAIDTNIIEFIELSDSQIAMSQSIQTYQKQLEVLLDSFIKLIADAIDAKSAYTGSHCKKVPVIATMLAQTAESSTEEPFGDFCFKGEESRKAFERAAWLHDCGKITTPEYVVDKATKLETIHNRIHEIRTRFEIIWRDIEITYHEDLAKGEEKETAFRRKEEAQQKLQDDFAFIASCNLGGECMEEEKIDRIHQIAQRTWWRHFDDTLGLSDEELSRYPSPSTPLPAEERLLDDKPSHLIPREHFDPEAYRKEHFMLEVPQWLYNRGEIYNLCIKKGTLTPEERYKINEHVIMTIKMLESLPFPESMKEIPRFAGEHHETMDGRGYPRKLTKKELSLPSRIMAIADIFEALTASDRPYKKAKTLSEALRIMYQMKKEQHIDADLFDLFIRSGVYRQYAKRYLRSEQIDTVDEASLLH